jgi:hypothetical protein
MIAKFDTQSAAPSSKAGGKIGTFILFGLLIVAGVYVYTNYIAKPKQEKDA